MRNRVLWIALGVLLAAAPPEPRAASAPFVDPDTDGVQRTARTPPSSAGPSLPVSSGTAAAQGSRSVVIVRQEGDIATLVTVPIPAGVLWGLVPAVPSASTGPSTRPRSTRSSVTSSGASSGPAPGRARAAARPPGAPNRTAAHGAGQGTVLPPGPATAARPAGDAVTYRVRRGDTLFAIARRHGTTVQALVAANRLASPHRLRPGQVLAIPGRTTAAAAAVPRYVRARLVMAWPTRGVLTSRFGWRYRHHHDGIDLAAPHGTPIYAARAGRVVFAGWYYGYGRTVILDHGNGLQTLYGHASSLLVRQGQQVERGQLIARVGCTGSCTGSHLHFEVRLRGRAVNPLGYLR